jgi:hypothetical protein
MELERKLFPLALFGSLGLIFALVLLIPGEDALPVLVYLFILLSFPIVLFAKGIKPIDPGFPPSLFALAFIAKLAGSLVRFWMAFDVYGGYIDASQYHDAGQELAAVISRFDFTMLDSIPQGTEGFRILTGIIYIFLPPSMPGSFLFFGGLAFIGSVFFYRAFRVGFPDASPNLFRLIIFFLPSILFWPSSLGKDAWVFFSSGFVAYGLAVFVRKNRLSGLLLAGLGILFVSLARSHIAMFIVGAIGVAYFLGRGKTGVKQIIGGLLIIGFAYFIFQNATDYLTNVKGLSEFSWSGIQEFYEEQQEQTFRGGSRFAPVAVLTILGPIYGFITVLFRPFLWEAGSPLLLIAALESVLWLGLFWAQRQTLIDRVRLTTQDSWIGFLVIYSIIMILALTAIGNFGILARQRVMLLPFLWMLLA